MSFHMLALRGELVDLESKIDHFRARNFELRGTYRILKLSTRENAAVSLEDRMTCKSSFGPNRGVSSFGVYVQTLDRIVAAGFQAANTANIEGIANALRTAVTWVSGIEALLMKLEGAVRSHVEVQDTADHRAIAAPSAAPPSMNLAPIFPHPDLGRKFLPAFTATILEENHTVGVKKTKLDVRFQFDSFHGFRTGPTLPAKPKIDARDGTREATPLAPSADLYEGFVDIVPEAPTELILHHPRPVSLSPKTAVESWIAEPPETVEFFEIE